MLSAFPSPYDEKINRRCQVGFEPTTYCLLMQTTEFAGGEWSIRILYSITATNLRREEQEIPNLISLGLPRCTNSSVYVLS